MKPDKFLLSILLLLFAILAKANDTTNMNLAKSFVHAVSDERTDLGNVINKYLCIDKNDHDNRIKLLIEQLNGFRQELRNNPTWTIENYQNLPLKDQSVQIDENEKRNVYALNWGNNKEACFIWIQEGKIVSFVTMNKGKVKFFLKNCR